MSNSPSFKEEYISQLPALQLLMQLGFTYLTPDEALALRGGTLRNVVLLDLLREWLKSHNAIRYRGQRSRIRRFIICCALNAFWSWCIDLSSMMGA